MFKKRENIGSITARNTKHEAGNTSPPARKQLPRELLMHLWSRFSPLFCHHHHISSVVLRREHVHGSQEPLSPRLLHPISPSEIGRSLTAMYFIIKALFFWRGGGGGHYQTNDRFLFSFVATLQTEVLLPAALARLTRHSENDERPEHHREDGWWRPLTRVTRQEYNSTPGGGGGAHGLTS